MMDVKYNEDCYSVILNLDKYYTENSRFLIVCIFTNSNMLLEFINEFQ